MKARTEATLELTAAQRYFYDVNGYVLLKGIFSPAECQRFIDLANQMDADDTCTYKHDGYPKTPTQTVLSRCSWYHPHLLETAHHPVLLPIIEDVVGGEVRLEEHQFLINYPAEELIQATHVRDEGWHRGTAPNFGSFEAAGHYHCMFSKAFIYLTDNGPGEGTWVMPGSHRMDTPAKTVREFMDDTLVRQLESHAGDVLILSETLIHAGPRLKAGASPRYSLVYGYTAPFMQTWRRYDPPADLLERVTPQQQRLLTGELRYGFRRGQF
ncbi:MAG: phytanoyl-CoA dioxygenase family protein [Candidatus Poribacteria bacterium]|nr:phytanoyl-CoA dioxygenase family protein [Candidatus Poribacteria bacterium]